MRPARASGLTAIPDAGRHLSDGLVVEGALVARLLGLRLLAVDARLVVAPAALREPPPPSAVRARPERIGAALTAAERCLDDGAASLEAARDAISTAAAAGHGNGAQERLAP